MTTNNEPEQPVDYRAAQADAKAAAARARALRPWYRKKRYIIGGTFAVLIVLGMISSATGGSNKKQSSPTTSTGTTGASSSTEASPTRIGDLVKVGSLDLTVLSVKNPHDTTQYNMFNKSNISVRFKATNARGDKDREYSISQSAFKLVDDAGVAHDAEICIGCPDAIGIDTKLILSGSAEWNAYFLLPAGRTPVELRYDPLISSNKARISLK